MKLQSEVLIEVIPSMMTSQINSHDDQTLERSVFLVDDGAYKASYGFDSHGVHVHLEYKNSHLLSHIQWPICEKF